MFRPLILALFLLAAAPPLAAQESKPDLIKKGLELARRLSDDDATDFIRVVKGKKSARLETAAVTYEDIDRGLSVTLFAAVHIADKDYYESLQKQLVDYDLVLFEGINRDTQEEDELLLLVGRLQLLMKKALRLEFQPEMMDMSKENMRRADIDASELKRELADRGVGLIPNENLVRSLFPFLEKGFAMLADDEKPEGRIKAMIRDKLQRSMADLLGGGLGFYERFKREEDRLRDEVIIGLRNRKVMAALGEEIERDPARRIAILYGAAHHPDFESRLVEDLGLSRTGTRWLPAWRMGKKAPRQKVEPKAAPASRPAKKI